MRVKKILPLIRLANIDVPASPVNTVEARMLPPMPLPPQTGAVDQLGGPALMLWCAGSESSASIEVSFSQRLNLTGGANAQAGAEVTAGCVINALPADNPTVIKNELLEYNNASLVDNAGAGRHVACGVTLTGLDDPSPGQETTVLGCDCLYVTDEPESPGGAPASRTVTKRDWSSVFGPNAASFSQLPMFAIMPLSGPSSESSHEATYRAIENAGLAEPGWVRLPATTMTKGFVRMSIVNIAERENSVSLKQGDLLVIGLFAVRDGATFAQQDLSTDERLLLIQNRVTAAFITIPGGCFDVGRSWSNDDPDTLTGAARVLERAEISTLDLSSPITQWPPGFSYLGLKAWCHSSYFPNPPRVDITVAVEVW